MVGNMIDADSSARTIMDNKLARLLYMLATNLNIDWWS